MPFEGPGSPILPDMDTYSFDAEPDEPAAICGKMDGAFVEATFRRPCVCYIPGKGTATMVAPGRLITTTDIGSSDHEFDGLTARFNFRGMLSDQWVNVRLRPQDMFLVNEDIGYVLMACEIPAGVTEYFGLQRDPEHCGDVGDSVICFGHPGNSCTDMWSASLADYNLPDDLGLPPGPLANDLTGELNRNPKGVLLKVTAPATPNMGGGLEAGSFPPQGAGANGGAMLSRAAAISAAAGVPDDAGCPVIKVSAGVPLLGFMRADGSVCRTEAICNDLKKKGYAWNMLGQKGREMLEANSDGNTAASGVEITVPGLHGTTIMSAMAEASPGDVIVVLPGVYKEMVELRKEVELVGEYEGRHLGKDPVKPSDVVIESSEGTPVFVDGSVGPRMRNFIIRQRGQGQFPAVVVSGATPSLQPVVAFCDIVCESGGDEDMAAVMIKEGATPIIDTCIIHNSRCNGVMYTDRAGGRMRKTQVYGNALAGVVLRSNSNPKLIENFFRNGKGVGVHVDDANGLFVSNEISQNCGANVLVSSEADPIFEGNQVYDSKPDGVVFEGAKCKGQMSMNSIFGCEGSCIVVRDGASPEIVQNEVHGAGKDGINVAAGGCGRYRLNRIQRCLHAGLSVSGSGSAPHFIENVVIDCDYGLVFKDGGRGRVEENRIGNHAHCCCLVDASDPIIERNQLQDSPGDGLWCTNSARPHVVSNDIRRNGQHGILATQFAAPRLVQNDVYENRQGVCVWGHGCAVLDRCKIHDNAGPGVVIMADGKPSLENVVIKDNAQQGVLVYNGGAGSFVGCEVSGSGMANVEVHTLGNPVFTRCDLHAGQREGVLVQKGGKGVFEHCDVHHNNGCGVAVLGDPTPETEEKHDEDDSNPSFNANQIRNGKAFGVMCTHEGRGVFEDNDIHHNERAGVFISTGGNPTMRGNFIHDGLREGILVDDHGRGVISRNVIYQNLHSGVGVSFHSDPVLTDNTIRNGCGEGVWVGDNGKGILEENDIHENGGGEVHISTYANPMLRKNHIHNSPESGVKIFEHGRGTLRSNHVNFNSGPNIHVTTQGSPDLVSNHIIGSPMTGVLVEKLGGGRFHGNQILNNQTAVHVRSEAMPTFHTNKISGSAEEGVKIEGEAKGRYVENEVSGNVTGFSVTGGSSPVMIKNSIKQNSSLGVLLDNAGSESQYLQNTITGNSVRLQSDSGCPDGLEP